MKTIVLLFYFSFTISLFTFSQKKEIQPIPSIEPNKYQKEQIKRKFGMFIHFGINSFHDQEWTDGSKTPQSYNPTTVDAKQWVQTAKKAGMKYIILVAKHHDGFCLWDSKHTEYDVAKSGNQTDVIEAVAIECKKQGIKLGLYYSLWDRKENADVHELGSDVKYNKYVLAQLKELIDITHKHTKIVELWLDGCWVKENSRWSLHEIYSLAKKKNPACQIGVNWTIGLPTDVDTKVLPTEQKEMYPIRYFPSDFRLGDPYLPVHPDPKLFTHQNAVYYMPWETTTTLGEQFFYNTGDTNTKSIDQLELLYHLATSQDNILILNVGPNREGRIKDSDVDLLLQLKDRIDYSYK